MCTSIFKMSKFLTLTIFFTAIAQGHSLVYTSNGGPVIITTDHVDYIPEIKNRIWLGDESTIQKVPWQVSILKEKNGTWRHWCGGSIISSNWVLSAGHCFKQLNVSMYAIRAGTTNVTHGGSGHHIIEIKRYPGYTDIIPGLNDIALLKVKEPFKLNNNTRKVVPLYMKSEKFPENHIATISGWGRTKTALNPAILNIAQVPIMTMSKCRELRGLIASLLYKGYFCAGYEEGGKDSCQGDSGGPLTVNGRQVGIVSTGPKKCGAPRDPGIYTEVAYYRDWIQQVSGV